MNQVNLARLSHDVVQNTYKELHALLDSLGDVQPEEKREKLLAFLLQIHHRFARLLVAVRWYFSYSAFHNSAQVTRELATRRSNVPTLDADTLWMVSNVSRGAAAQSSAIAEAAEVLGASSVFDRIPRVIEASIGKDARKIAKQLDSESSDDDLQSEVKERLRVATRLAVSNSLPEGVKIIKFGVPPNATAIRIGIKGAWTADVLLDRLQVDNARLHLLRFAISVDTDPDASSPLRSKYQNRERGLLLPKDIMRPLREMIHDRMGWIADETGNKENRMKNILTTLAKALSNECCAKISMDHIRSQLSALMLQKSWRSYGLSLSGVGSQAGDNVPVVIRLWPGSHMKGSISTSCGDSDAPLDPNGRIVHIKTSPEAWSRDEKFDLDLRSINMESLILQVCQARAVKELKHIQEMCTTFLPKIVQTQVVSTSPASVTLLVKVDAAPTVGFEICLRSGGLRVYLYRSVPLAAASVDSVTARELKHATWSGNRFFRETVLMFNAVKNVINKVLTTLRIYASTFNANFGGFGTSSSWPPGPAIRENQKFEKAGIHILPPFTPLERKRPRTFLTVNYADKELSAAEENVLRQANKRRRLPRVAYTRSSDGCAFVDGNKTLEIPSNALGESLQLTASRIATFAESRQKVALILQVSRLLKELENLKLAVPTDEMSLIRTPHNVSVMLKTRPIQCTDAHVSLSEDGRWAVQLTVTNEIFDDNNFPGFTLSYSARNRRLTFTYPTLSPASISCFTTDLARARVAAALAMGLSDNSRYYKVLKKLPTHVELETCGLHLTCGRDKSRISFRSIPEKPILSRELLPLLEEVLSAAGPDMTTALPSFMETAIPLAVALEEAAPKDPKGYKIRFHNALLARISVVSKSKKVVYTLELDVRRGRGLAVMSDVARIAALRTPDGNAAHRSQTKPIPIWDAVRNSLTSNRSARSVLSGCGIAMDVTLLKKLLPTLIKNLEK